MRRAIAAQPDWLRQVPTDRRLPEGRVIAVDVAAGDPVTKGQKLLTLEAMKMEHGLTAPFDGMVTELNVTEGQQVTEGTLLVRIEKNEGD